MWQEFEIEVWISEYSCCKSSDWILAVAPNNLVICQAMVVARAFITSQSAEAHLILFRRMFEIMEHDTGRPPQFLRAISPT